MLKLQGDFTEVKAEMKKASQLQKERIKQLKKSPKLKDKSLPENVKTQIKALEHSLDIYSASKVLPVKVEGIVINYKLCAAFIKKIESFNTSVVVLDDGLVVQYWRKGTLNQGKGVLKLYDISSYFSVFETIPVATLSGYRNGQKA